MDVCSCGLVPAYLLFTVSPSFYVHFSQLLVLAFCDMQKRHDINGSEVGYFHHMNQVRVFWFMILS